MIDYIKFRLKQAEFKSIREKIKILKDIYKELEERGYNHLEIYEMINEVIINNLKGLSSKLKNLLKNEKEKK